MFCDRCKIKIATIHLTEIIKDERSEAHLCENCAREIGFNSKLSNFSLSVSDMLSFLDVNDVKAEESSLYGTRPVCSICGTTFMDFKRSGRLGCEECYTFLDESLIPVISSYHGEKRHIGKIPDFYDKSADYMKSSVEPVKKDDDDTLENLKLKLDVALLEERYEDAALFRDLIRKY